MGLAERRQAKCEPVYTNHAVGVAVRRRPRRQSFILQRLTVNPIGLDIALSNVQSLAERSVSITLMLFALAPAAGA
jgi:hypothetical protein